MLKTVGNPSTRYGDQTILDGNLVIGTAGKGIDFSATASGSGTMTSEVFDDYEEGTFTPVLNGTSTAGAGTYNVQLGYYRKVGDIVHVWIAFFWTAHTGTGNVKVTGLPFTVVNLGIGRCPASLQMSDSPWTAGNFVQMEFEINTTEMYQFQVNSTAGAKSGFPLDGSGRLYIQGSYLTT
jgi:hypothetical protein